MAGEPAIRARETRLASWRKQRGLTQEELARATGISRSVYWRLENNRNPNPPLRYLVNCALALGCSLDDLIEDDWREWLVLDQRHAAAPPNPAELGRQDVDAVGLRGLRR